MKNIVVGPNEAGQRLDKLLAKYLKEAPKSFFYKMLRKKNITLNGKRAEGNEKLQIGDEIKLFLADETIEKFMGAPLKTNANSNSSRDNRLRTANKSVNTTARTNPAPSRNPLIGKIVYEDDNILLLNKPSGMLSQKAKPQDVSVVEYLIDYMLQNGQITEEALQTFHPSICNRLDRNTSGLLVCGKSLLGLQKMSEIIKERSVKKYYRCLVAGQMQGEMYLNGYLTKDEKSNQVRITDKPVDTESKPIETEYKVLSSENGVSLLEVHLITGRSHQIRAHLASIGHPIIGDTKYGNSRINQEYSQKYRIKSQMLHAYRLEFPKMEGELGYLSGKKFIAPTPREFERV